jgi:hypothetical protein
MTWNGGVVGYLNKLGSVWRGIYYFRVVIGMEEIIKLYMLTNRKKRKNEHHLISFLLLLRQK